MTSFPVCFFYGGADMRKDALGHISDNLYAIGVTTYPGYVLSGSDAVVMVEGGINILGPTYREQLDKQGTGVSGLDCMYVTHGHYDHIGSYPYLKKINPNLKIGASGLTDGLINKDKVLASMNFLSDQLKEYFPEIAGKLTGSENEDIAITPFSLDHVLAEGDVIDIGGTALHVIETPGHTRDHISYYVPEQGILFPGEALGNPIREDETTAKVEFLSSFRDYISSMEKLMVYQDRVDLIAMSHLYYYTGDSARRFFDITYRSTREYKRLIDSYLDESHGDVEKAISNMVRREYDEKQTIYQERNAFVSNLSAQIAAIAAGK